MTFPGDGTDTAAEELDEYLAGVMDDYLAECEASPVRFLSVLNNGREYKVRVENNVIWFPSYVMRRKKA